ncbi:Mannose-1-phosphate guanylyltransferase 1 (part 1) [Candidatus Hamiltonella defensa (Bemisia tabaci)]|nr:Mannose-1-phosphate guanylyltransferase 1 (part 1) [Candidatus Hamiltonella defensa (Bemisia tabaci)]
MLLPIIMAGGSGSRLWPLSRELYPKQFLTLTSKFTLLQDTFLRLEGIAHQPPLVICHDLLWLNSCDNRIWHTVALYWNR